jgi:hypothetical protein
MKVQEHERVVLTVPVANFVHVFFLAEQQAALWLGCQQLIGTDITGVEIVSSS